jgi:hypothetical protein
MATSPSRRPPCTPPSQAQGQQLPLPLARSIVAVSLAHLHCISSRSARMGATLPHALPPPAAAGSLLGSSKAAVSFLCRLSVPNYRLPLIFFYSSSCVFVCTLDGHSSSNHGLVGGQDYPDVKRFGRHGRLR